MNRRRFLGTCAAVVAAPAIVHAEWLMPGRSLDRRWPVLTLKALRLASDLLQANAIPPKGGFFELRNGIVRFESFKIMLVAGPGQHGSILLRDDDTGLWAPAHWEAQS